MGSGKKEELNLNQLILRCYGFQLGDRPWVGVCLNLDLAVEADSREELKKKMRDVIESYIETVLQTDDHESIPALLSRRAPLKDWSIYYLIRFVNCLHDFREKFAFPFNEAIPFHLAHSC